MYLVSVSWSLQVHSDSSNVESILKKVTKKNFNKNRPALIRSTLRCVHADYNCQHTALSTSSSRNWTDEESTASHYVIIELLNFLNKKSNRTIQNYAWKCERWQDCHNAFVKTSKLTPDTRHLTNSYQGYEKKLLTIKPDLRGSELCFEVCMLTTAITMDL